MEADLEAVGIAEVEYLLVSHVEADLEAVGIARLSISSWVYVEADLEAVGMAEVKDLLVLYKSMWRLTWRL